LVRIPISAQKGWLASAWCSCLQCVLNSILPLAEVLISSANEISGSQTGSQRSQPSGDTGRRPATISPANCLFRRRQATSCDGSTGPYKQEAGDSNPPAPTRFLQLDGLFETLIEGLVTTAGNTGACSYTGEVPRGHGGIIFGQEWTPTSIAGTTGVARAASGVLRCHDAANAGSRRVGGSPRLGRGAGGGGHRRRFRGWPGVPERSPGRRSSLATGRQLIGLARCPG
jgi:hypothetical protein